MAISFLVVFFFYPETKGITLEEVEIVFGSGAGTIVKQALGRRGSLTNTDLELSESPTEEYHATLNEVPKGEFQLQIGRVRPRRLPRDIT